VEVKATISQLQVQSITTTPINRELLFLSTKSRQDKTSVYFNMAAKKLD